MIPEKLSIGENWPASGEIIFHNVSILYSGNVVPVARNINIHIRSGEKVSECCSNIVQASIFFYMWFCKIMDLIK